VTAVLPLLLLLAGPTDAYAGTDANACLLCHPRERVDHEQSVHRAEGIDCVSCHGGDSSATEVAKAHGKGYRGVPARRDIPGLCAGCHADVARMRPYNLPTDQLALYRTSQHGSLLEKGDDRVAVCTDCHGVHDIRPPEDPLSPVFRRNIPKTCARCHGDPALAAKYGWKSNPYDDYAAGVHGKALLEKGSGSAPECSRCHGAHGAAPTGVGDVDKICGQCHPNNRAAFLEGPHKEAMVAARLPECASCHGHHRVESSDPERLDRMCARCHDKGSEPMHTAVEMKTLFASTAAEIEKARELVGRAAAVPIFVEDYEARLEEARTLLLESGTVMHTVDSRRVQAQTERARTVAHEVQSEVHARLEEMGWRRVFLLGFWFYLALTVAIIVRSRRRAAAEARP
jgi:hypothetical protein